MIQSTQDGERYDEHAPKIAALLPSLLRTPDHQSEGASVPPGEFASQRAASITAAKNSSGMIDGTGYFCWGRENLLNAWPKDASQSLTAGRFLSPSCRLRFNTFGHIWNTNTLKLIAALRKTDGESLFSSLSKSPHLCLRGIWAEIRIGSDYWQKTISLFLKWMLKVVYTSADRKKICLLVQVCRAFCSLPDL